MNAVAVSVEGLRKSYGDNVAVRDVSFSVERGEILGILGPNGSGKTTTVECLQGLRSPDRGDIRVLGLDPATQTAQLRRRVGSQLQDSALPDRIRVGEALRLFASVGDQEVDVEQLLRDWDLHERRKTAFGNLSGGQRQRLLVALALVNAPELVFLDEMTTGLDPAARREAWRLIERVRDVGTTVILVTHFMDEAERLCDRLIVIRDGTVVATGSPAQLIERHGGGITVQIGAEGLPEPELSALPGVSAVRRRGKRLEIHGDPGAVLQLGHFLVERGLPVTDLYLRQPSLEDAFFHLVGEENCPEPENSAPLGPDGPGLTCQGTSALEPESEVES